MKKTHHVILYTRKGCHLCDDALEILREHGLEPECRDIDHHAKVDAELFARFDACLPVVEIDGKIRFRGRVEPLLLKRLLQS